MTFKKKMLLLSLVATMAVSITACGGSNTSNNNGSTASPTPTPAPVATAAPEATVEPKEHITIEIMGNYNYSDLSDTDKALVADVEAMNNVTLNFEIPPSTGYGERLQLMLASGKYPDLVFFPNTTDQSFLNAVKDGIIVPVNDYIANAPHILNYTYQSSWDQLTTNQDGNIYGVPRTSVIRNDTFWVRKDWLDNIGFTVPADSEITLEQFEEILTKFTIEDPDKNGKNDTYGYVAAHNSQKVLEIIAPGAFGLTGWQESNGGTYNYMNPVYDSADTKFKEALDFSQKMYTGGYLHPDSATNDETAQREYFWRGDAGVMPGFSGHYSWHLGKIQETTPTAELTYLFVKNQEGKVTGGTLSTSPTGVWGFWAITSTNKDPQRSIDILDSYISEELWDKTTFGYEGIDYTITDGVKAPIAGVQSQIRKNTMRRANDINFFFSIDTPDDIKAIMTPWLEKSLATVVPGKDIGFLPEAGKKPNFLDYKAVYDQTVMKIIMGAEPVSKYDELLDGWYKNGGEDYIKEMNDYIKKMENGN